MIIYCDTSFLVSLLNEEDVNYPAAREWAGKYAPHDFVLCEVHRLELPAAVRAATHREHSPIPEHIARRIINRFDRAKTSQLFLSREVSMADSVSMARSLGEAYGWREQHTTFDLWHLAAAWSLSAGAFLTFDKRQKRVASLLGMA